ncbi:Copper homeostasis protein cutC-like protein, partial [Bienertia sinuspersici]
FLHGIMADELIEGWKKFNLTEDEENEIDMDEVPDDDMAPQVELALVGKLFTNSSFNIEAMKSVLRSSWKPIKGLAVREIDHNLFIFQFFYASDRARVIDQSPWSFDNHLLLLREISGIEQPRNFSFDTVDFWIRIYNVPFVKRSRALASLVGNKLGQFLDYDESNISGWSKYMRARVRFNVYKPLPRGTVMKVGGERIWVDIKIERLPGFCYCCGCLGYVLRECSDYDEEVPEADLPYRTWLRASPIKNKGRGAGAYREAKQKLFHELREGAKKKLKFSHDGTISQGDPSSTTTNAVGEQYNKVDRQKLKRLAPGSFKSSTNQDMIGSKAFKPTTQDGDLATPRQSMTSENFLGGSSHGFHGVFIDCAGHRGGLALLWNPELEVELLSMSLYHIDCRICWLNREEWWRFTRLYGWCEGNTRHLTCKLLEDLYTKSDLPWLVGGDINEICYNFEKWGGATKQQGVLEMFRDTFQACDLWKLGYKGNNFTWWNNREVVDSMEECLDRYLVGLDWSVIFPWAEVWHLDELVSDHLPICSSVKSAYHYIMDERKRDKSSSSNVDNGFWKGLWGLDIPPRIRIIGYALFLECPAAEEIWLNSGLSVGVVDSRYSSIMEFIARVGREIGRDNWGDMCGVMGYMELGEGELRIACDKLLGTTTVGLWKLNMDAAARSEKASLGLCIRYSEGEIVALGVKVVMGWSTTEIEEARAVYYGMLSAWECGY